MALAGCGALGADDPRQDAKSAAPTVEPAAPYQPVNVSDLSTRKAGVDWPSFLGPNRDSRSPESGIVTKWSRTSPSIVWTRRLGTSYAMPSISRGRLFQFDRVKNEAVLFAMKSETGEPLWRFSYPTDFEDPYGYDNGPRSSPVVDDDRVYIYGAEGMLHCLRVTDGTLIWMVDTMAQFGVVQNFFGVGSTPVIEGELLIVMVGGSPTGSEGTPTERAIGNGSGVVAFDKFTGKVKYQLSDELASYASPMVTTIGDRRWCFVFARGGLLGFEPSRGALDFHYPWRAPDVESVNASNPVVVGDLVFISETYGPGSSLLTVRPGGYDVVWADESRRRAKIMQTHWNTPIHHDGYLYASSGRHTNNAELRCIELATGNVQWKQPGLGRASLLYVDGHFVCLCEYGELLLIRATHERFDLVATADLHARPPSGAAAGVPPAPLLEYPCWAAPILSHGLLYVRGKKQLVCLQLIAPQ